MKPRGKRFAGEQHERKRFRPRRRPIRGARPARKRPTQEETKS